MRKRIKRLLGFGMKVSAVMTEKPVTVSFDISIPSCARKMLSENVGSVIIKKGEKILGIVTEKDIVEQAVGKELDLKKFKVRDIMTSFLVTVKPNADLSEAVKIMIREDVRRLPVVENGKLVGLLTAKDILKVQPKLYKKMHSMLVLKKLGK